ncbi:hypothetical protein HanXRQr2_Chr16g0771391 [Helianthus annuus]|uniref:Uncharacterized protein n=1 Tax=Helianthus annuus TaxID=4232 RepID=A0A9K3GZW9_HELAN|nr:hypothetical protein HanXRQr2_Chr16g0771391 [Helianthus annuus]KAJ0444922.1 hypothetical protein HanIR_Chr16g0837321 [Helianthus annuus]KAJ0823060.1 hypothetical protein HanPSC8_Chr16g0739461 [Helianthus annuus]
MASIIKPRICTSRVSGGNSWLNQLIRHLKYLPTSETIVEKKLLTPEMIVEKKLTTTEKRLQIGFMNNPKRYRKKLLTAETMVEKKLLMAEAMVEKRLQMGFVNKPIRYKKKLPMAEKTLEKMSPTGLVRISDKSSAKKIPLSFSCSLVVIYFGRGVCRSIGTNVATL